MKKYRWLTIAYYFFSFANTLCLCVAFMAFAALGDEHNNTLATLWVFLCYSGAVAVLSSITWHIDYLLNECKRKLKHESKKAKRL